MRLGYELLNNTDELRAKGYAMPQYDVFAVRDNTLARPVWAHFGAGNIFRAHIAMICQNLLNSGAMDTGIVAFAAKGSETFEKAYAPFDNMFVNVSLCASGKMEKTIAASVTETHNLEGEGFERAEQVFTSPTLQLATFTITEKGYAPAAYAIDLGKPLDKAETMLGQVTRLLKARMEKCGAPLTLVSLDNCSKNGDKLKEAIMHLAAGDEELIRYIDEKIAFPWTMIDKITPRPDGQVLAELEKDGFVGMAPVVTSRGTYIAPFVNAEEKEYLVIEDDFPGGRPPLEMAGVYLADRETVERSEKMKVTACLNPLHTALAVFGCLLGYNAIWKETQDEELNGLIRLIGYGEGLKKAPDPGIFTPESFLNEVINTRLPNPFLPDTPQRIATDTSHKVAVRFGETIKAYGENACELIGIPLAIAGWLRYLDGVDDEGNKFVLSDDPRMEYLMSHTAEEIAADSGIFGVDLKKAGLYEKVLTYLTEMRAGRGAVRATLRKYIK